MRTTHYSSEIKDIYGGYSYRCEVGGTLYLVDNKTGKVVVEYSKSDSDDKFSDAAYHIFAEFYKKCNEYLKEQTELKKK